MRFLYALQNGWPRDARGTWQRKKKRWGGRDLNFVKFATARRTTGGAYFISIMTTSPVSREAGPAATAM